MSGRFKLQRYDKDCYRIMYGPHIRGFLLRLTNERWGIYDAQDKRLTKLTFQQTNMALAKFEELVAQ